jgi:hypothetical protein
MMLKQRGHWGINSVGRVPALQAGCQRFKSAILHLHSRVAQRQSGRLLIVWSQVQILPRELGGLEMSGSSKSLFALER